MKQTNINDIQKLVIQLQTELNENSCVTDKAIEINNLLQIEVEKYNKLINSDTTMNTATINTKTYIGTLYITKRERVKNISVEAENPEQARELMEQIYWDYSGALDDAGYYVKYDDAEVEAVDIQQDTTKEGK